MPLVVPVNNLADFGAGTYKNIVRKFGRVDLPAATEAILWDGANGYDGWLAAEEDIEWSSSSVLDVAGQNGVSVIFFTGQGNDGMEKTYQGVVNGQTWTKISDTPADVGIKFKTIYTGQAVGVEGLNNSPLVGATPAVNGSANLGTITIRSVSTQKIMGLILPNLGRTQMMLWRCPADHYAEFKKISIYPVSGKPVLVKLMARDQLGVSWLCLGQIDTEIDIPSITFPLPQYVSPGTDICIVITSTQANTVASAQMWIKKLTIPEYEALLIEESL